LVSRMSPIASILFRSSLTSTITTNTPSITTRPRIYQMASVFQPTILRSFRFFSSSFSSSSSSYKRDPTDTESDIVDSSSNGETPAVGDTDDQLLPYPQTTISQQFAEAGIKHTPIQYRRSLKKDHQLGVTRFSKAATYKIDQELAEERRSDFIEHQKIPEDTSGLGMMAQAKIREAMARGEFNNLSRSPENPEKWKEGPMRMEDIVMKNNNVLPDWIEKAKEITSEILKMRSEFRRSWEIAENDGPELSDDYWKSKTQEFRQQILSLNKKINDYNLMAPSIAVHKMPLRFEWEIERAKKSD